MKLMEIKTSLCFVSMLVFLIIAFTTKDVVNSQIFASLGIITGAVLSKNVSTQNQIKNE